MDSPAPMADVYLRMIERLDARVFELEQRLRAIESGSTGKSDSRQDRERDTIVAALEAARWNKVEAAKALGMARRTLYRKMDALGIK